VDHPAVALVLTGLDLPDFVRFMGAAGAPLVTPTLLAFAAPLLAAAVAGCLAVRVWSRDLWFQGLVLAGGVWLASVAFSPLERRMEFLLVGGLVAAVWLVAAWAQPWERWVAGFALAAGAVAPALAVIQFLRAEPALSALYGRDIAFGPGVWLAAGASLVSVAWLVVAAARRVKQPVPQRT
jgi:hypothetical protein